MNQRLQQSKSPWVPVKTFSKNDIAVRVEMFDGWRPRYRVRFGALKNGEFFSSVNIRLEGQGKVQIHRVGETISALTTEAENWIHNEAQHREDVILEDRIGRETKQANHGKQQVRVTGKTQKQRDKRKPVAA